MSRKKTVLDRAQRRKVVELVHEGTDIATALQSLGATAQMLHNTLDTDSKFREAYESATVHAVEDRMFSRVITQDKAAASPISGLMSWLTNKSDDWLPMSARSALAREIATHTAGYGIGGTPPIRRVTWHDPATGKEHHLVPGPGQTRILPGAVHVEGPLPPLEPWPGTPGVVVSKPDDAAEAPKEQATEVPPADDHAAH